MARPLARLLCTLLLAVLAAPAARAQFLEPGWTFDIGVGKAKFKDVAAGSLDGFTRDFFDSFTLPVQSLSSTLSTSDRAYSVISGYRFSPFLAVEGGYFRLGAFQYNAAGTVSDAGTILPASMFFSYRAKGFQFGGVGTWPIGDLIELRARAGLASSETRVRIIANVDGAEVRDSFTESSQDFYYGAGVALAFWEAYRLGLDFTHYEKLGKTNGNGSTDVDSVMLSIGFRY